MRSCPWWHWGGRGPMGVTPQHGEVPRTILVTLVWDFLGVRLGAAASPAPNILGVALGESFPFPNPAPGRNLGSCKAEGREEPPQRPVWHRSPLAPCTEAENPLQPPRHGAPLLHHHLRRSHRLAPGHSPGPRPDPAQPPDRNAHPTGLLAPLTGKGTRVPHFGHPNLGTSLTPFFPCKQSPDAEPMTVYASVTLPKI